MSLLIDLGGTHIRFARSDGEVTTYKCCEYASFFEAVDAYRKELGKKLPNSLVMGVPGPVSDDVFKFDNNPWTFSVPEIQDRLGFNEVTIVNDFEAAALAIPFLSEKDIYKVNTVSEDKSMPIVVMGAGTGLGQALLIPKENRWIVLGAEGGHSTLPATNEQERALLAYAEKKFGHVSAERFVSGKGLCFTFEALHALNGTKAPQVKAHEITRMAIEGDKIAQEAYAQMFAFWGTVAGNIALMCGAFGGVYLTGGMIRQEGVLELFKKSPFMERLIEKGRRKAYMERIPVRVVTAHETAFLGLLYLSEEKNEEK